MPVLPTLLVLCVVAALLGTAVLASLRRRPAVPPAAAVTAPAGSVDGPALPRETVLEVSGLVARGRKIEAIKLVREATGVGLKEAKDRVEGWSDAVELSRLPAGPATAVAADERLRVEAAAVVAAAGWHSAEAFLREQRGLSPEAARALLDSVS